MKKIAAATLMLTLVLSLGACSRTDADMPTMPSVTLPSVFPSEPVYEETSPMDTLPSTLPDGSNAPIEPRTFQEFK